MVWLLTLLNEGGSDESGMRHAWERTMYRVLLILKRRDLLEDTGLCETVKCQLIEEVGWENMDWIDLA